VASQNDKEADGERHESTDEVDLRFTSTHVSSLAFCRRQCT
jgi:hypothetical protein